MEVGEHVGQLGDLSGIFGQSTQAVSDLSVREVRVASKYAGKLLLCARQHAGEARKLLHLTPGLGSVEALPHDVALDRSQFGASRPYTVERGADLCCYLEAIVLFHGLPSFVAGERGTLHVIEETQRLGNAAFAAPVLPANHLLRAPPVAKEKREKL